MLVMIGAVMSQTVICTETEADQYDLIPILDENSLNVCEKYWDQD